LHSLKRRTTSVHVRLDVVASVVSSAGRAEDLYVLRNVFPTLVQRAYVVDVDLRGEKLPLAPGTHGIDAVLDVFTEPLTKLGCSVCTGP